MTTTHSRSRILESFDELCDGVDRFHSITYDRRMTAKELRTIAELLKFNSTVEVLFMQENFSDEDHSAIIAEGFEENRSIRKFWFEANCVSDEGAQCFARVLQVNSVLTELYLRHNDIHSAGAAALAEALKVNATLHTLSMRGNAIGDGGATAFAEMLRVNRGLETLSLCGTSIGDIGAIAIAESLEENISLREITLEANCMGVSGTEAFFKGLKKNTVLKTLTLSANRTGPIAPEVMIDAFKHNHCMAFLEFDNNQLGDAGTIALARGIKVAKTLSYLNLEGNDIREEGAVALAAALTFNTSIELLLLRKNRIGDKGVAAIADSLRANSTLLNLRLSGNGITDIGAKALASALKENTKLSQLSLSDNEIGHDGGKELCKMLWVNRSLIHLSISGNHLAMPYDEEILRSLYEQVARRNRQLQRDMFAQTIDSGQTSPWQRGRLLVLGPQSSGKSRLIAALVDEHVHELNLHNGQESSHHSKTQRYGTFSERSGQILREAEETSVSGRPAGTQHSQQDLRKSQQSLRDDQGRDSLEQGLQLDLKASFAVEAEEHLAMFDVSISQDNRWSLAPSDSVAETVVTRTAAMNFEQTMGQGVELTRTASMTLGRKSITQGLPPRMPSAHFKADRARRHPGSRPSYDEMTFSKARNGQQSIGLSIVDLSGNAPIRHLLFSPRALYLLSFSLTSFSPASLSLWLNTVRFHCPSAHFLLAGMGVNAIANDPSFLQEIDASVLRCVQDANASTVHNEAQALSFFPIELRSRSGIEPLRDATLAWLKTCKSVSSVVSIPWMLCLHALLKLEKPWVALGQVKDLAAGCGVSSQAELAAMVAEMHDLGMLINLKETESLRSVVVLQPKWLLDNVSKVLRVDLISAHEKEAINAAGLGKDLKEMRRNAVCSLDLLQFFWGKQQLGFLCDLMRSIFLLADWDLHSEERRFILPSIVRPESLQDTIHRPATALKSEFCFSFLPNGLFERFMCLCIGYSAFSESSPAPTVRRNAAQFWFGEELKVVLFKTNHTITACMTEEKEGSVGAVAKALRVLLAMITKLGDEVGAKEMFQYQAFVQNKAGKMVPLEKARAKKAAPWFQSKKARRRTKLPIDAIAKFL